MKTFWNILGSRRGEFAWLLAAGTFTSTIEAILHPLMLMWLFDEGVIAQNFRRFIFLSTGYLAIGLFLVGSAYVISLWNKNFSNRVMLDLELRLIEQSLHLDWKSFAKQGSGGFVSRIHKDTLEGFVPALTFVVTSVRQAVSAIAFTAVLFYLSWTAALALVLIVPPLIWVARYIGTRVRKATADERDHEAGFIYVLTESLKAFRALRTLNHLRTPTLKANRIALDAYLEGTYQNTRFLALQQSLNDIFMNLANVMSLVVGGYFVLIRELTFGGYLAFVNAFWRAVDNIFSLLQQVPNYHRYTEILKRLEEILSLSPAPYASPSSVIRLRSVHLNYDKECVLNIPWLEIFPGERVLLVGPNGVGKTSLLHILSGYLPPDKGEVALPERIASLTAPVEMPPFTVDEMVTDPELVSALGLEVIQKQRADTLSSGQRQRVAIGALLSQDSDLYILDEPLANLDDLYRKVILDLVMSRTHGKILVVVLHQDKALRHRFDRVVNLEASSRTTSEVAGLAAND